MHPLQRRAVMAILSMIESGVRELRVILSEGQATPQQEPVDYRPPAPEVYPPMGALSDEEDDTLEQMMERQRLELLRASESLAAKYYEDDQPPKLSAFFEGDDQ